MKICWDMLEGMYLNKNGTLRKGQAAYIYKESCANCGEPYLAQKRKCISSFCSYSCVNKGKKLSDACKKKMSIAQKGKKCSDATKKLLSIAHSGKNNGMYGKKHSIETIKKMSEDRIGVPWSDYKDKLGLTKYSTYKIRLELYEEIREQKDTDILEVRCAYCGSWYSPTYIQTGNRLAAINNLNRGEQRFYCSENCKQACPAYRKIRHPKGFKHTSSREVSTYLRQMVLERDNWECQICGKTVKEIQLHVHHMDPVAQNPMFQNDTDSCITLCKDCHKKVHKQHGCRYVDLRCK